MGQAQLAFQCHGEIFGAWHSTTLLRCKQVATIPVGACPGEGSWLWGQQLQGQGEGCPVPILLLPWGWMGFEAQVPRVKAGREGDRSIYRQPIDLTIYIAPSEVDRCLH